jgi:uncharacterized protein (TIGR02186 family)
VTGWRAARFPAVVRLLLLLLAAALPARMAHGQEELPLVAALSQTEVEISTGFTGASLTVFGSTEQLLGPGADEVIIVARGPTRPIVVRRKVQVLWLLWVNGPSARFGEVPGFYAIAGTRPAWQLLPEQLRQHNELGLDALPLASSGARSPAFRAALLELAGQNGLWLEDVAPVEIRGSRLFHMRLDLPATVPTGDYQVHVLLIRSRRIVARQHLEFRVERVGAADRIATVADRQPLLYGVACVVLAALAGWVGSVLFRRS